MNSPTLAGSYPKIGIRPTIDGRLGGVREQWTDYRPNGDFLEAILNSSFDWNGRRAPYLVATENDAMNGASVLLDCVPPERLARVRHARPRGGRLPRLREFRPALPLNLMTPTHDETRRALLALSHELGAEHRHLAILGEGNTSAKLDGDGGTFLVKASGSSLGTLGEAGVVECRAAPLLAMLDRTDPGDQEIEDALFACRVDPQAGKPSVEALFHAYLLSLPNVGFVGHVHSVAVNQLLCSPRAREFAGRRLFADEIVAAGRRACSCLTPIRVCGWRRPFARKPPG